MDEEQVYVNTEELLARNKSEAENIYMNEAFTENTSRAGAARSVNPVDVNAQRGSVPRAAALTVGLLCALLLASVTGIVVLCTVGLHIHDQLRIQITNLTNERDVLQTSNNAMEMVNKNLNQKMALLETEKLHLDNLTGEIERLQDSQRALITQKKELELIIEMCRCPKKWVKFSYSCYFISQNTKNWTGSKQECEDHGATLVIISSPEEQKFVRYLSNQDLWLGLTDGETEGQWKWVNGDNVTTMYWRVNQPDNWEGHEDCAEYTSQNWNDANCSDKKHFVCEKLLKDVCNRSN